MDTASKCEQFKIKGNEAYKTGDYTGAISLYTSAIELDPSNYPCLLNRLQAYLKLKSWSLAESDATKALEVDPKSIKALYRRAIARREQRNFAGVWEDIELFSEAGGDASVSKSELARIRGFEVTKAGAKGLGVFALQDFYRGDLVIAEAPLFSIRRVRVEGHGGIQYRCGTIEAAIDALTPEKRRGYESLDNARPREMCRCGIFSTNSFGVDEDDSVKIFLQCSRFNHSCTPNARYSWNPEVERFRIYAFRDIARGEEIFVTYLGRDTYWSTRAERQARLQPRGFTCTCAVCTQPNTAASDERRVRIKKIWESRSNLTPDNSDEYLLAIVHAIHLLKEEGCADGYDEFTDVAAWICAIHSDWASAKYWATETYKAKVAEFGEDNYMAKEAKEMLEDPKTAKMAGMGPRKTFSVRL